MALSQTRPATAHDGADLGIVFQRQAVDNSTNSKSLAEVQADFLAARFGLAAERARLVAALAFEGARQ